MRLDTPTENNVIRNASRKGRVVPFGLSVILKLWFLHPTKNNDFYTPTKTK